MRASQELLKDNMLAKMETYEERLEAHHERMVAKMDSWLEKMEACLEKTEATEEIESELGDQEVPKEGAAVELPEQLRRGMGTGI
jgi:hypothetical protein